VEIPDLVSRIREGKEVVVLNRTTGEEILCGYNLTPYQREVLLGGGRLNYIKSKQSRRVRG